uniref:Intercellular adhesion molecule N-terminal domain-containing protein n=1 Tax=Salarias fasciatus TaxID=181472 RepID=A0A672GW63_SALFA
MASFYRSSLQRRVPWTEIGLFSPYPGQSCADAPVFTPSSLVVQYGANASAACAVCRTECNGTLFGLEIPLGVKKVYGTTLQWEVDNMTEWETSAMCYYNHRSDGQCVTVLPVTVYREHTLLSMFSFVVGGYTLHCVTHNVAPIGRLVVTFYRGQTVLGRLTSNSTEKKPVTETFSLKVNHSRDDSGALIRCEAELQLGPEGPRPPPVVTSYSIAAPTNCETKKKKRNLLLHETIKLSHFIQCLKIRGKSVYIQSETPVSFCSHRVILAFQSVFRGCKR